MSTKYIASNWRLPNEENSNKSDNYGLSFNGSNEYIDTGDAFTSLTSFSISAWFKSDDTATAAQAIVSSRINSIGSSQGLDLNISGDAIYARVFNNGATQVTTAFTDTASWHHIVMTYNGTTLELFLDNVSQGTATGVYTNSGANWLIGKWNNGANYFNGSISECAFFDYALSSTQISTLYGSSSLGAGNPMALKPQPVAYYPLGDNSASNPLTQPNEAVEDASVFDFDRSTQDEILIDENNNKLFQGVSAFTVSAWAKVKSQPGYDQGVVGNDGSTRGFYMSMRNSSEVKFFVSTTGSSNDQFTYTNPTSTLNNWIHFVVIWDGSNMDMYINGMYSKTQACVNATGTFTAAVGTVIGALGQGVSSNYNFDGEINNVQIWYQRLSHGTASVGDTAGGDIATLYNSGVPLLTGTQPQASNLKAWYKLDQSANWEADSSGAWQIPDAVSAYPQSFNFDGSQYINIADSDSLSFGNGTTDSPFSISAWVNFYDMSSSAIITKRFAGNNKEYSFHFLSTNKIQFTLFSQLSGTVISRYYNTALTSYENQWIHLVGTYDGSSSSNGIKIYLNGNRIDDTTYNSGTYVAMSNGASSVWLGWRPNSSFAKGKISNAQIYDIELSSSQVETLYNNGSPLTTAIASDNLKAWYKLDNTATFSTNWSIPDASGNGNTGTSSGMTEQSLVNNNVSVLNGESSGMTSANLVLSDLTRAVPYDSYSFNFDSASSDYIDCGNDSSLQITTNITLSTWVNIGTSTSTMRLINKDDGSNRAWIMLVVSGKIRFTRFYTASNFYFMDSSININDSNWHNIVCVNDSTGTAKIYIDGVEDTATTGTNTGTVLYNASVNLKLGGDFSSQYLNGKLSNCAIFNQALTSTEVMKLYSNGVPQDLTNFTPTPVSWWTLGSNSFWNGSNWICRDLIGSNDGTSANAGVDAVVGDSPRSESNGTGTNMDIPTNLEGSTKWSDNNSWSINMSESSRVEDTP